MVFDMILFVQLSRPLLVTSFLCIHMCSVMIRVSTCLRGHNHSRNYESCSDAHGVLDVNLRSKFETEGGHFGERKKLP